jgi:MFS family permease
MKAEQTTSPQIDAKSFGAITFLAIAVNFAFGLPLPSLKAFVETSPSDKVPGLGSSEVMFGFVVTCFSVGAFLGAIIAGYIRSRFRLQRTLTLFNLVGLIGAVCCGLGFHLWSVACGRALLGAWLGGLNVVIRAYIARTSPKDVIIQRMSAMAGLCAVVWAISPAIGGAIAASQPACWGIACFDKYRAPGWVLTLFAVMSLAVQHLLVNDEAPKETPENKQPLTTYNALDNIENGGSTSEPGPQSRFWYTNNHPNVLIVGQLLAFFVFSFGFMALETLATPLMADQFGVDIEMTSTIYLVAGSTSGVAFLLTYFVNKHKWLSEFWQMLISLVLLTAGFVVLADFQSVPHDNVCSRYTCSLLPNAVCNANTTSIPCQATPGCIWNRHGVYGPCETCPPVCHAASRTLHIAQLYAGFVLNNLAFTVGRLVCGGYYARLIKTQPSHRAEVWMMTYVETAGNIARIVGPVGVMSLYEAVENHTWLPMAVLAGMAIPVLLLFIRMKVAKYFNVD